MKVTAPAFLSFPKELSKEHLISFDFDKLKSEVQQDAPVLWELLRNAAYRPKQEKMNLRKDPDYAQVLLTRLVILAITYE